jgi:hypothetical protein
MCHADQHWTEVLPLFLLGIRSFKADLHASSAELMYGETLRIPGEFLTQTAHPIEPAHLITQLRQHMSRARPVPATRHARPGTFVHKNALTACSRKTHHSVNRQDQTGLHIQRGRLHAHHLQPCSQNATSQIFTASSYPHYAFRSSHPLPPMLQHLSNHLRGGMMWEPPT